MHPKHFRRHSVHPSHLGGGHGRSDLRFSDCADLLLCGELCQFMSMDILCKYVEQYSGHHVLHIASKTVRIRT